MRKYFYNMEPLSAEIERGCLVLYWNGNMFLRLGLRMVQLLCGQVIDSPDSMKTFDAVDGAQAMAEAYSNVRAKYSGQRFIIKSNSKHWAHIERAAEQAKAAGIDAAEWCEIIVSSYTDAKGGLKPVMPWPNQLHGDTAAIHVSNVRAKTRIMPGVGGIRRARLAAGTPLQVDMEFQRIKNRMKKNIHTLEDVAYVRTRQVEIYGVESTWLAEQDRRARARETGGNDGKGDS